MNTDIELLVDVLAAVKGAHITHAAKVGAIASEGVVTVFGDVVDGAEKQRILRAVRSVSGVHALAVSLNETRGPHATESDAEIAGEVVLGLRRTQGVPAGAVSVMVEAGNVTMAGEVDFAFQKQSALDSVRYLRGVCSVCDEITVRPTTPLTIEA
jgi:osmotically-inducible protein OsmY